MVPLALLATDAVDFGQCRAISYTSYGEVVPHDMRLRNHGGGAAGAPNDRAEWVGQGVPKRSAPDDVHVDRFEDLDPPEVDPSINLHTGKRGLRENANYVALSLWGRHW